MSLPNAVWTSARELGGEAVRASVVGGAEGDALVVPLDVATRLEREDLVAAGVGEDVARPSANAWRPPCTYTLTVPLSFRFVFSS